MSSTIAVATVTCKWCGRGKRIDSWCDCPTAQAAMHKYDAEQRSMALPTVTAKLPEPVQDAPERVLMRRRREALVLELRAIEDYLGMEPHVRALCPECSRKWNQKKAG